MRTLIQGGWVVGFQNGHHAIIEDGVVVLEDDAVLHVGPSFDGTVDETIDAKGKLVSPGWINIHAVANIDIQTLGLDASQPAFTSPRAYAVDNVGDVEFTGDRLRTSALFSVVELLKGGATTIVEISTMAPSRFEVPRDEAPVLAEVAGELGARIYVSHKFRAGKRYMDDDGVMKYHWDEEAARNAFEYAKSVVEEYEGAYEDRVRTMLFPYQFDACPAELLRDVKIAAREMGVPVHMHTSQSLFEFHDCLRRYNKTPVQLLDSIGFLDERTILTHLIYTTAHPASGFPTGDISDLRLVADRGANVAHCAVVYARHGKILGSFSRYREMGINVPIGTDTFPQDLITEMRWAALACKWTDRDRNRGTAREVFNAVTVDGARALGRDDIGRLAPGAKADVVIVDFTPLHIGPVDDPIKALVYTASGTDIETVIVDGKVVVKEGRVPGVDESELVRKASEAHMWQKGRFVGQNPTGRPAEVLFPSTYEVM